MMAFGLFLNSRQAATADGPQHHAPVDPQSPRIRHPGAAFCGENRRNSARCLPGARTIVADWWPLLVAGVGIALLV